MTNVIKEFDIPVLFLVFNRLDTTRQVFQKIREIKPARLYIGGDGHRKNVKGDKKKVRAVRDFLKESIDWNCKVKTLYREHNLGCRLAVSSAIDWFFENEEMGIILEDDCLPTGSFFSFTKECLIHYRNDQNIFMIAGSNFTGFNLFFLPNHFTSKYASIWGWATWRDRWEKYDVNISNWRKNYQPNELRKLTRSKFIQKRLKNNFDAIHSTKLDSWAAQVQFTMIYHNMLCIYSRKNLISNIGFVGAHFQGKNSLNLIKTYKNFQFVNVELKQSKLYDFFNESMYQYFGLKSAIYKSLPNSIKNMVKKLK